jgi:hypothetical protein
MGFRQNIGTPIGRLGKIFGLFSYYDIYLQVLKLDGLAVMFPTKPYLGFEQFSLPNVIVLISYVCELSWLDIFLPSSAPRQQHPQSKIQFY